MASIVRNNGCICTLTHTRPNYSTICICYCFDACESHKLAIYIYFECLHNGDGTNGSNRSTFLRKNKIYMPSSAPSISIHEFMHFFRNIKPCERAHKHTALIRYLAANTQCSSVTDFHFDFNFIYSFNVSTLSPSPSEPTLACSFANSSPILRIQMARELILRHFFLCECITHKSYSICVAVAGAGEVLRHQQCL